MLAYKFRLYPSKQQEQVLFKAFDLCRFTYNQLLEKLNKNKKISHNAIQHSILGLKKDYPELKTVHSKAIQYECYRLSSNLRSLAQLKRNGQKVGRLRFKGRDWFKTINYNQSGFKIKQTGKRFGKLLLSKVGNLNIRCHRITSGKIKQITIKKSTNKWYAILITDGANNRQCGAGRIGLDFGIINFVADSNGNKVPAPLFLKKSLVKIKTGHQTLSKKKRGSNNWQKAKQRLNELYEKVNDQRNDFLQKLSTKLVSENKLVCIEKLDIKKMSRKNKRWNKRNMLDCSWATFTSMLKRKAESAGAAIIEVHPRNTTKMCSNCGSIQDIPLSQRTFYCDCGLELDRDINAAKNILALGWGFAEAIPLQARNGLQESPMKQEAITTTPKVLGYE